MQNPTRLVLAALVAALISPVSAFPAPAARAEAPRTIKVYKSPTCGCCANWVEHLKAAGFAPEVHDVTSMQAVKSSAGVPPELQSCHTALIGGYIVEGHVPADVIERLLKERPKVAGIAVAGMPVGSPGMEQGDRKDAYQVIAFTKDGKTSVYASR